MYYAAGPSPTAVFWIVAAVVVFVAIGLVVEYGSPLPPGSCATCRGRGYRMTTETSWKSHTTYQGGQWRQTTRPDTTWKSVRCHTCGGSGRPR